MNKFFCEFFKPSSMYKIGVKVYNSMVLNIVFKNRAYLSKK